MRTVITFKPGCTNYGVNVWNDIKRLVAESLWFATHELVKQHGRKAAKEVFFYAKEHEFWSPQVKKLAREWLDTLLDSTQYDCVKWFCGMWGSRLSLAFESGIRQESTKYLAEQDVSISAMFESEENKFIITNPHIDFIMRKILVELANKDYGTLVIDEVDKNQQKEKSLMDNDKVREFFSKPALDCWF